MKRTYKTMGAKEQLGTFIERVQNNMFYLAEQYKSANELGKPAMYKKLVEECRIYSVGIAKAINDGNLAADPAGLFSGHPIKAFQGIIADAYKEAVEELPTKEEAQEVLEAAVESAKHTGILGKMYIGVKGGGLFVLDIASGIVQFIWAGICLTYEFAKRNIIALKDWAVWCFKPNTETPETLMRYA